MWLNRQQKYMLLAPKGAAVQNIGCRTMYSALHNHNHHQDFHEKELLQIQTVIIDKISMVSAALSQISIIITLLLGINIIVAGDLAQLPSAGSILFYNMALILPSISLSTTETLFLSNTRPPSII